MNEIECTTEYGPVYGVELPKSISIGGMLQACPGRAELERVRLTSERTVAAYEVLADAYRELLIKVNQ